MAVAIRGGSPLVVSTTGNPISGTLTGSSQPQAGDLLVILHANDYYDVSNMPTPTVGGSTSGVTAVTNGTGDAGNPNAHVKCYTYAVGSTGDLTVSVTETGSADEEKVLVVYVLSGADTASPIDGGAAGAAGSASGTAQASFVLTGVTPVGSDAYLIYHVNSGGGSAGGTPYTPPSGMTEQYDTSTGGVSYCGGVQQLSSSGATGTRTVVGNGAGISWAGVLLAIKTSSGGGGSAAPIRPVVVTRPAMLVPSSVTVLRAPAASLPSQQPLVITRPPAAAGQTVITARGTSADPPVLTTPAPTVVTRPAGPPGSAAILLRNSPPDVQVPPASTPQPVVVTSTVATPRSTAMVGRGSLADAPVLTTVAPYVVTTPTVTAAARPVLLRGSLADVAASTTLPAGPYVVAAPTTRTAGDVVLLRGSLADAPVLTTPAPLIITMPVRVAPSRPVLSQGGPPDLATPEPLVITTPDRPRRGSVILASGPVPPPPTGPFGPTTVPIVVTAVWAGPRGSALLVTPPQLGGTATVSIHPHPTVRVVANLTAPTAQYPPENRARYLSENRVITRLEA